MMEKEILSIQDLSFSYGTNKTLDRVSLSVTEGEYVSIIGPNGAGKSTMLRCLNRIIKGGEGKVTLCGRDLHACDQKELGRMIGYVSQNRDHTFPYTVYEFVMMGRYPYLSPLSRVSKKDKEAVDQALLMTGTTLFAHRKVHSLSGGERQKVYLAGALAQQPKILFLDEPTTHLDPRYQVEIQQTIAGLCAQGMTILHVTHDLNHIFFWSHKVLALKEGRVHTIGLPVEVLTRENLKAIFDTDFILLSDPTTDQTVILPKVHL